jgi:putative membrane protein insertion efficiency factor
MFEKIIIFFASVFIALTYITSISFGQTEYENNLENIKNITDNKNNNKSVVNDYIGIYQKYISQIRGQECPMYPSCSNYGIKVFNKNNLVSAFFLTSDRLLRCGHDLNKYSLTLTSSGFKYIDYPPYEMPPNEIYYTRNSYYFAVSNTQQTDSIILFINSLINRHYYQEALLEIHRVEYNDKSKSKELFTNKIVCLKALGEYESALFEFDNKCPEEKKLDTELNYQISFIHYKLKNYELATSFSNIALKSCSDDLCQSKIHLLQGLIYASNLKWANSLETFERLSNNENFKEVASKNILAIHNYTKSKIKNANLAGILSIIPGAGYAYAGNRQTAISALVINSMLSYATYTSFKTKNYGIGILTSIFNLSFYLGSISGASKSAKRHNESQIKKTINKLEFNSQLQ